LFGGIGVSNYAAANAFMDGLAQQRQRMGLPGLSINWGEWSGIGMAKKLAADRGAVTSGISVRQALLSLEALLSDRDAVQVGVAKLDSTMMSIEQIPFLTELTGKAQLENSSRSELLAQLEQADNDDQQLVCLQKYLEKQLRDVLQWSDNEVFPPDEDFFNLGMDSLVAVEFSHRLQRDLANRLVISAPLIYHHPQIDSLSDYIFQKLSRPGSEKLDAIVPIA